MKTEDRAEFVSLLNLCYSTLQRPLPTADGMRLWENLLRPYSIEQISAAFYRHMQVSEFAPKPANIIAYLTPDPAKDGRPDANEAWAIALRSRDERDTVVWTQEAAQAFAIASAVLDGGDEVGARMAFKAAYERLVEAARAQGTKAAWVTSLGHDPHLREQVLTDAVRAGQLQIDQVKAVVPALAAPVGHTPPDTARANLARLKAMLGSMPTAAEKLARAQAVETERVRKQTEDAKRAAAEAVAAYEEKYEEEVMA